MKTPNGMLEYAQMMGLVLATAMLITGCGTSLVVKEIGITDTPTGVVVNKPAKYRVSIKNTPESPVTLPKPVSSQLSGVDQLKLMVLNFDRNVFATGNLQVELTTLQTPKKVTLESKPGTTGALGSMTTILETDTALKTARAERRKAELEAAEAADEAAQEEDPDPEDS